MTSQHGPHSERPKRTPSAPPTQGPEKAPERLAAARGFVEALRRVPAALRRPEALMLAMAIFASIGVHMPPYVSLGALADYWKTQEANKPAKAPPSEVSFEISDPVQPDPPPAAEEVPDAPEQPQEEAAKSKPPPEKQKQAQAKLPPKPEAPKPEPEPVQEEPTPQVKPPEQENQRRQSITQKSDQDVDPPPEARFLAEESRKVEEETVAMVRDEFRDDETPEAAAPADRGTDEAGGDTEDTQGYHETGEEEGEKLAEVPKPEPAPKVQPSEPEREAPADPGQAEQKAQEAVAERQATEAAPALPGTVINDPMGSFTLATADEPNDRRQGQAARSAQAGRAGQAARVGTAGDPRLAVSWKAFEDTYDAETLARERTPKRRERAGSSQRKKRWKEFRAAIENYVVGVRPGNQTALNAAADPFAAYIAAFHRHLHMEFAHRFLASLPATGEMADPNLVTKVEIVVNSDGSLHRVGVVNSSGQMLFDFGAFNAVKSGEPYPQPPSKIRSADGRVYIRWGLHRDLSQCGTWNAEPYLLKDPPDVVDDAMPAPPGMQLGPRQGPG